MSHAAAGANHWQAIWRGFTHRCPRCGEGALFRKLLKFSETCPHCGAALGEIRADDMPAWLTILVTGHVVVPVMLLEIKYGAPDWVALWGNIVLALALVAALLPSFKGAVGGLLWSMKMPGGVPD